VPSPITTSKMFLDHIIGYRNERLVRAFPAFYLGLSANSLGPFVGASQCVARSTRFPIFPPDGQDVGTASEQSSEKRYLFGCRRRSRYCSRIVRLCRRMIDPDRRLTSAFKRREALLQLRPFGVQRSKPGSNTGGFVFFSIAHKVWWLRSVLSGFSQKFKVSDDRNGRLDFIERNAISGLRQP
jgi:hypothetical protein